MNPRKRYRIPADKIEKAVVDQLGALLKEQNILEEAIEHTFNGENTVLKQIDNEIAQKVKESKQCQRLLEVFSQQGRIRILDNPELLDAILLEGIKVKKESEAQIKKLDQEIAEMQRKKDELAKFNNQDEICTRVKQALRIFKKSSLYTRNTSSKPCCQSL